MEYPAHITSGQARTGYVHGYRDAKEGKPRAPYAGKITRAAYEEGYRAGEAEA